MTTARLQLLTSIIIICLIGFNICTSSADDRLTEEQAIPMAKKIVAQCECVTLAALSGHEDHEKLLNEAINNATAFYNDIHTHGIMPETLMKLPSPIRNVVYVRSADFFAGYVLGSIMSDVMNMPVFNTDNYQNHIQEAHKLFEERNCSLLK